MHIATKQRLLAGAARGLLSVRAEGATPGWPEVKALMDQLQKTQADFRAENDRQIADLKKGLADVVTAEKVEKLNAALGDQQKVLDEAVQKIAALQVGGAPGGPGETAEARAHRDAFNAWIRRGTAPQAAVTTYNDPGAGFLAPATVDTMISRVLGQTLALRRLAQVLPISNDRYVKFKSLGGATSGWVGETQVGSARGETSTPTLARMEFTPGEVYAEPYATQQALDDLVINVEEWLATEVNTEFAEKEGAAFVSGNGVVKPRGFLSYDTALNSAYAWGKVGYVKTGGAADFAELNPADALIDTVHALKPGYRQGASWLMNDLTASKVRKLKDGLGNYLWQASLVAGQPSQLLGYSAETDDNMPDMGANTFPIAFAAWRQAYLIVDRMGVRVLRNPYKSNGQVAFYTTKRVGGGIQNFEAIKLLKCAA